MVQSLTEIANLAVLHCGVSKPIGNIQTEKSPEAQACRTAVDICRQTTLRRHPWLFAKKFANPPIVSGPNPMATIEWTYSYRLPADCLHMVRIVSNRLNNDTRQSRIPYTMVDDDSGALLYTNWPGVGGQVPITVEYTFDNQNIAQWPSDFCMAMSYYMAYVIAPVLTSGDPYQMQQKLLGLFDKAISMASNSNSNEEQRPEEPQSEFVRSRDGSWCGQAQGQNWESDGGGFVVE